MATYRIKEKLAILQSMNGTPVSLGFEAGTVVTGDLLDQVLKASELEGLLIAGILEPVANLVTAKVIPG
jgi:hypothetical protein